MSDNSTVSFAEAFAAQLAEISKRIREEKPRNCEDKPRDRLESLDNLAKQAQDHNMGY